MVEVERGYPSPCATSQRDERESQCASREARGEVFVGPKTGKGKRRRSCTLEENRHESHYTAAEVLLDPEMRPFSPRTGASRFFLVKVPVERSCAYDRVHVCVYGNTVFLSLRTPVDALLLSFSSCTKKLCV